MFGVAFVFVAIQLLAEQHEPVLFQLAVLLLLFEDLAFDMDAVAAITAVASCFVWHAVVAANAVGKRLVVYALVLLKVF